MDESVPLRLRKRRGQRGVEERKVSVLLVQGTCREKKICGSGNERRRSIWVSFLRELVKEGPGLVEKKAPRNKMERQTKKEKKSRSLRGGGFVKVERSPLASHEKSVDPPPPPPPTPPTKN